MERIKRWITGRAGIGLIALLVGIGIGASGSGDAAQEGAAASGSAIRADAESAAEVAALEAQLAEARQDARTAGREAREAEKDARQARRAADRAKARERKARADVERAPSPTSDPAPPDSPTSYSGNGGKSIGTITIEHETTLEWTNSGDIMQIYAEGSDGIPNVWVNAQSNGGETVVSPGTYKVDVNAIGDWTLTFR